MPRVALLGGAYSAKSPIANVQRCFNLYPEKNPDASQAPVQVTHYPRQGRTRVGTTPEIGRGRCLYTATNGDVYCVIDNRVYYIDPDFQYNEVGDLTALGIKPVYMADNGLKIVIVDGSLQGYEIDMVTRVMEQINNPNYLGSNFIGFLDGFLIFNKPDTPIFYSSLSYLVDFNALDFGVKSAWPDNIVAFGIVEREIWLFGSKKGEIWYNAGSPGFSFQALPGIIVEFGCAAPYSVAVQDINIYWLSQSPEGGWMMMKGKQHAAERISTFAIEAAWRKYPKVDDAISSCYQIEGHFFLRVDFPTADKTWIFDEATQQWHEEGFTDKNGIHHRMRDTFTCFAYNCNLVLDWSKGDLYKIDPDNYTDAGDPIVCIRTFPHLIGEEDERVTYTRLIADIEAGTTPNTFDVPVDQSPWSLGFSDGFGPAALSVPPQISLRCSRTRGISFDNAMLQPMGSAGHFSCTPTWNRLGMARDMVFELSWSSPMKTALNGVFVTYERHEFDMQ